MKNKSSNKNLHKAGKAKKDEFYTQLALNALWSILFFGLRSPGAALIDIVLLWLAIVFAIRAFYPLSRSAAWLLAPYLAWVSFAAYLNYYFLVLNR